MNAVIRVCYIVLLACWPVVTFAGGVTLGATFGQLAFVDVLVVSVVSLFSGAVALLQRMDRNEMPAAPTRWIVSHMLAALLAGWLAMFLCEAADVDNWLEALAIALCAWIGARVIDRAADRVLGKLGPAP